MTALCYCFVVESFPESLLSIALHLEAWLETPAPMLGDAGFLLKLAALGCAMVAGSALLLSMVLPLARTLRRTLSALGGVRDELFVSEAAHDLEDEGARLDTAIAQAQAAVAEACRACADEAGDSLQRRYNALVSSLNARCEQIVEELSSKNDWDAAGIEAWIDEQEESLRRAISDEAVRIRIESRRNPADEAFLNAVRAALRPRLKRAPVEFRLRQDREELAGREGDPLFVRLMKAQRRADLRVWGLLGRADAEIRVRRVPFRAILDRRINNALFAALAEGCEEIRRLSEKASDALLEAARILRFNLDSAGAELEEPSDEDRDAIAVARELAKEGLERTAARLKKLLGEVEEGEARFLFAAQDAGKRCAAGIRRDADVADTFGERAARIGGSIAHSWEEFIALSKEQLSSRSAWREALRTPLEAVWGSAAAALGLGRLESRATQAQLEEATVDFVRRRTPPLYRRLFNFDPLSDEDFLEGRDEHLERFARAKERLAKGLSASVAVTGPTGAGKTSLLRCALRRYFKSGPVLQIEIETPIASAPELVRVLADRLGVKAADGGALAAAIAALETPPIVFLKGGSRLFERRVGGLEAMQAFLSLLTATEGKALWVVSFSRDGWSYLDRVLALSKRFDEHADLDGLDRGELERAMMARHEISGYELDFAEEPGLGADAAWRLRGVRDPRRRQEILREEFFDELHAAAGSNLHAALYYWLRYTKVVDRRRVVASPLAAIPAAALRGLGDDYLFTMLFVFQHDRLTPRQHARLLRMNEIESGLTLDYLTRRRVLLKTGSGPDAVYGANPILSYPVEKILKERNLIHA
ncbi:MAG: hypothetical protein AUJ52_06695 [Elusimicrobia bacterium CG1_02_63_36]|nr:MAG: hypothetical protein AUJ52_06695 [Elusimicrobia bacterium CG1_02_63_36]PIP83324.1 MAG: hypothetical protein COR54_10180 [Elusimicrobia bacterium CG22_combo_CG10-13_8_21_14_all_63_91]PJB26400.1 MAG: hypothetical protein CO113_03750 [Elusimicrobia bacterium CG_4_9_14_3_um_filter_62_55]